MPGWYRLNQLTLDLEAELSELPERIGQTLQLPVDLIGGYRIRRKSLDARGQRKPFFIMNVDFQWLGDPQTIQKLVLANPDLTPCALPQTRQLRPGNQTLQHRPVIVGAGPAGLMAALRLGEAGYQPILLERGDGIRARVEAVEAFWKTGVLDPDSNIQFGAGGAGTFSDGKLVTRIKDPAALEVLEILASAGGSDEICYEAKAHIGTDRLRDVVARLEQRIRAVGGEIRYRTRLDRLVLRTDRLVGIRLADGSEIPTEVLIVATGHSARELYETFYQQKVEMEPKPIAVGFRIEHPQDMIDRSQYGRWAGHPKLGAADYRLTHHDVAGNRGVYSFCMCPGGVVVAAASEPEGVVTNGMSYYGRDSGIANAAIVATVYPHEYGMDGPLAGLFFQRHWERAAYQLGSGGYIAPAQWSKDFIDGHTSTSKGWDKFQPTYRPGVVSSDLGRLFPSFVTDAIRNGLKRFERLIPGFAREGILTGVETRTSAPLRILRRDDYRALRIEGLYPCGEGAGYAGGIVSAAVDGWHVAEAVIERYKPLSSSS
jgi:uncharacterized FAD-dependent dehydrogenase